MKWISLGTTLLLCTFALHARAEHFNKCSGAGGVVAYRSHACLPGERLLAILDPVPEVTAQRNDGQPAHRKPARRPKPGRSVDRRDSNHRAAWFLPGTRKRKSRATRNPCVATKKARDDFQRRRGIRITMNELSRWNQRVYDACK